MSLSSSRLNLLNSQSQLQLMDLKRIRKMLKSKRAAYKHPRASILLTRSVGLHKMTRHRFKPLKFPTSSQP